MIESFKTVLFFLVIAAGIAFSLRLDTRDAKRPRVRVTPWKLVTAIILLLLFFNISPAVGVVTTGERGVVLRFGAETGRLLGPGIYIVTPLVERVVIMSVQVHAYEAEADAASRDLQQVKTRVTLNYSLDPAKVGDVYRDLRHDYVIRIIVPAIQESVKAATAQFEAEKLIGQRETVKMQIEESLDKRLGTFGINVNAVSITDFSFSDAFNQAIEAKAAAVQQAAKAARDLDRVKMEAEQKVAQARAEAESLRIQKGNVTQEMLKLRQVEVQRAAVDKWNGQLPNVVTGTNVPFIMNLGQ